MRDPERLLDHGSKLEARLLASAVDEPPPPDLLGRTLDVLAKAPPLPGGSGGGTGGGTGTGAGAAAGGSAKAGGILGAAGIGAALGFLVVGGLELASLRAEPPSARPAITSTVASPPVALPPALPTATPTAAAIAPATASAPTSRPLTLAAELALLDEARSALREGDRAAARALLDRYAREIPRGQLGREAALLRDETEAEAGIDAAPMDP